MISKFRKHFPCSPHLFSLPGYWSNSSSLSISNRAMVSKYFYLTCNNEKYEQRLRAESNAEKGEIRKEKNNLYGSKGFSRNWSALHPFYYLLLMFKKIFLVFILYLFSSCVYYFICFASQSVDLGWRFHHPITTNYNYPQLISTWVRSVTAP